MGLSGLGGSFLTALTLFGFALLALSSSYALVEFLNSACSIDELRTLTRKKRMAGSASVDGDRRNRRAGLESIAADARYFCGRVPFGMNVLFHSSVIISPTSNPRLFRQKAFESQG